MPQLINRFELIPADQLPSEAFGLTYAYSPNALNESEHEAVYKMIQNMLAVADKHNPAGARNPVANAFDKSSISHIPLLGMTIQQQNKLLDALVNPIIYQHAYDSVMCWGTLVRTDKTDAYHLIRHPSGEPVTPFRIAEMNVVLGLLGAMEDVPARTCDSQYISAVTDALKHAMRQVSNYSGVDFIELVQKPLCDYPTVRVHFISRFWPIDIPVGSSGSKQLLYDLKLLFVES